MEAGGVEASAVVLGVEHGIEAGKGGGGKDEEEDFDPVDEVETHTFRPSPLPRSPRDPWGDHI